MRRAVERREYASMFSVRTGSAPAWKASQRRSTADRSPAASGQSYTSPAWVSATIRAIAPSVWPMPRMGRRAPWYSNSFPGRVARYSGSWRAGDLVICAHNYPQHFSPIKWITPGTEVWFTAADGTVLAYTVLTRETVRPTAISEMVENQANSDSGADWDLTLFTCNTGGETRCAVRCAIKSDAS